MSEVSRTKLPKPEPMEDDDMNDVGHGDRLEKVVERVVKGEPATGTKAERLKGDEVME